MEREINFVGIQKLICMRTLDGVLGHDAWKVFLLGKFPRDNVTLEGAPEVPGFLAGF